MSQEVQGIDCGGATGGQAAQLSPALEPRDGVPVVSVITPTYAVGGVSRRYQLRRAYESLLAQNLSDWEWLVVGDGCVDDTGQLVQSWAMRDGRVFWYNLQDHTGHPSWPRNAALAEVRGSFLAFLDDDS